MTKETNGNGHEMTLEEAKRVFEQTGIVPEGFHFPGLTVPIDMLNLQKSGAPDNPPILKTLGQIVGEALERALDQTSPATEEQPSRDTKRTFGPLGKGPFPHRETEQERRLRNQQETENKQGPQNPPTNKPNGNGNGGPKGGK